MSLKLLYSPTAARDLRKLGPGVADRVMAAFDAFASDGTGDVKRLQGVKPPEWRLRVGDYRAGFTFDSARQVLEILYVRHRRDAYR